jgi:hypothetical protein
MTNMDIMSPQGGDLSLEQVLSATQQYSPADLRCLRASILLKAPPDRSDCDSALLRVLPLVGEIHTDREPFSTSTLMWNAFRPPLPVEPARFLRNLQQTGMRLKEQPGEGEPPCELITLADLLSNPGIMRQHAVVILGHNRTTGYGKSAFMKHLAVHYVRHMHALLQTPDSDGNVVWSTTIDDLSGLQMKRGQAVCFDELAIADRESVQHMSETMLKIACDPQSSGGLRARVKNARMCADTCRLFSAIAGSLEEWAGRRLTITEPIRRKLFCFVIDKALVEPRWSSHPEYVAGEL